MADCLQAGDGFSLLSMGRPEGPGCYCAVNDLLRYGIERLSAEFDLTVIDCEAGPEQISRRVAQGVDHLIIVTDPTVRGIHAASLIKTIAEADDRMKGTQLGLIINKLKQNGSSIIESAQQSGLKVLGCIPTDDNVTDYDFAGDPLIGLPDTSSSIVAVREILAKMDLRGDTRSKRNHRTGRSGRQVAAER